MAPKASMALLFHPKKTPRKDTQAPSPKPGSSTPNNRAKPSQPPKKEDEDEEGLKLPEGPFQEYKLLSSVLNGWRYDVMKFDSRRPVDIFQWTPPIKLNRKDLRRDDSSTNAVPEAVGPMLGADGKPVIGVDGKMVMVDAEGRPIHASGGAGGAKDKGKAGGAKKRFQRKTRQVFFVPDEVRQLRREERYPWVLEDSSPSQNEVWTGQMEDATKAETHALFMPAANQVFKFVPAHRWYKFQKRLKHDLPTDTANVETLYNLNQKRDPQQWLATRKGKAPSSATTAMFKAEAEGRSGGSSSGGQSLGPGGRKLKTVDSGMDHLFDDGEDGDGSQRRRKRELGEEGDLDEQIYEEDFADDDEKMEVDEDDEEAKEIEERLKKEYKNANKQREAGVDESDDDDDEPGQSKQEKAMQKLIRKTEGNDAYDSEDEKNPYFSGEEEEEEEEEVIPTATSAIQEQQQQQVESRSQTPKPTPTPRPVAAVGASAPASRAASPTLSPGHGGHSVVAKRATSPKIPKPKTNISRGNSPLGGQSPLGGSRATSPAADVVNGQKTGMKRKADESPEKATSNNHANGGVPKLKKRKPVAAVFPIAVSSAELESMLVDWLRNTANATTRDCIHHFTPYLTDPDKKQEFSSMVRKHAILKNGTLSIKRAGSSAPSPPGS
ncbi:hypothetical protein CVT25_011193 [Psilocybe cyanescens]|uniref:Uncharacterized protein n=1 Tax=Psilocybe cyanescens TaxID=93625 RepID=A0A409WGU8_PSICY|nr:hypothetical protein CVT25_011193 [Psilocybe cyanescens]